MRTEPIALRQHAPVQFGGVGDAISSIVQKIDSSKAVELLTTDVAGMVVPRTYIEYRKRGSDIGRETFIREICGTVFNLFLIGWLGNGALKMMNSRSAKLNPIGLHTGAWINAKTMDVFGGIFREALNEAKSPEAARELFVRKVLSRIEATEAFTEAVRDQLIRTVDPSHNNLRKDGSTVGRLTHEGVDKLSELLKPSSGSPLAGTFPYEAKIAQLEKQLGSELSPDKLAKLLVQERLNLGQKVIASPTEKEYLAKLLNLAIDHYGLSGDINILAADGKSTLLSQRSLGTYIKELKHFLEHYADRVLADGEGKIASTAFKTAEEKAEVLAKLLGKEESGAVAFAKRYLPGVGTKLEGVLGTKFGEGLIPYALKSKWGLTLIPFLLTICGSVSVSFVNNWWTKRKYGGKVFFPGEGVPPEGMKSNQQPGRSPALPPSLLAGGHGSKLIRSGGPFEQFQRQLQGGRYA